MEFAGGAALEDTTAHVRFRATAEGVGRKHGVGAGEMGDVGFERFNVLNVEAEVLRARPFDGHAFEIAHIPRQQAQGNAAIAERVSSVAALACGGELEDFLVELGDTLDVLLDRMAAFAPVATIQQIGAKDL